MTAKDSPLADELDGIGVGKGGHNAVNPQNGRHVGKTPYQTHQILIFENRA